MKALDLVPSHLRERLGVTKVALSYIIRDNIEPIDIPVQANDSATANGFDTIMDELIEYTPHSGETYAEDNAKVFQILQDMVSGSSHESSVKTYQRSRNGRAAYLALCQHNLESSKWERIFKDAETYVMKREWNGKNARFTLKSHINKHRVADNEMVRAKQFIDVDTPNGYTRVGRLIKSITSNDPAIVSAITHIQGNQELRQDFERAADFLLLTAPSPTNNGSVHRISTTRTGDEKEGNCVEDRYYSKKEYTKLSKAQKKQLHELRKRKNKTNTSSKDNSTSAVAALRQQISDLESRLVAAINTQPTPAASPTTSNPLSNPLNQRSQS